jgi:hypothetical protein
MSRIAATFTESSPDVRLEIIAENRFAEPHSQRNFAQLRSGVTANAFRRLSILIRAAQASSTCGCGIRH